jgi:transcription elongation factor GreA
VTTTPSPTAPINAHDLLHTLGLPIEGPILWGRPLASSGPGVFIVEMPAPAAKVSIDPTAIREWLERAPDLLLDGKRPTVAELQSRLASFWLANQTIVYVGSSQKSVGARLAGMYKTPLGERRPLSTGYWLKTLHDIGKCRIWWTPTPDPDLWEDAVIDAFVKAAGALPFAVLVTPSGEHRPHGLTGPLHDSEPAKAPAKPIRVTVLPDALEADMVPPPPTRAPRAAKSAATRAPRAAARKVVKPAPTTGPSAIEAPLRRRSAKAPITASSRTGPTHLTPEGMVNLQAELDELTTLRRPEVIARIKSARELGDLSENADYDAARKEQSFLEGRVQQIQQMIKNAVIIETAAEGGIVVLGSTVTVETERHGQEKFTIVGSAEADATAGRISFTSPIGRTLMGRRAGETVRVQVPAGIIEFKIVGVK